MHKYWTFYIITKNKDLYNFIYSVDYLNILISQKALINYNNTLHSLMETTWKRRFLQSGVLIIIEEGMLFHIVGFAYVFFRILAIRCLDV